MSAGRDICLIGRIDGETPSAFLDRQMALLAAMPENVGVLEFWGNIYAGRGVYPGEGGYAWRFPRAVAAVLQAAHEAKLLCTCYVLPSALLRICGDPKQLLNYVLDLAGRLAEPFDGVYFDGIPPHGYDQPDSADWMGEFQSQWRERYGYEPTTILHASGQVAPAAVNLMTTYGYYGEHGGPVPEWSDARVPIWSIGEWSQIDRLAHPQYLTYTAALLKAGVIPVYKMASCHQHGEAEGYPQEWPTERQLLEQSWCMGACRQWAYMPQNLQPLRDAAALRAAYAAVEEQEVSR